MGQKVFFSLMKPYLCCSKSSIISTSSVGIIHDVIKKLHLFSLGIRENRMSHYFRIASLCSIQTP